MELSGVSLRLVAEERSFGRTRVEVGTHSGRVRLFGPPLCNFDLRNAVEWACWVLNAWDHPADPDRVLETLNRLNAGKSI